MMNVGPRHCLYFCRRTSWYGQMIFPKFSDHVYMPHGNVSGYLLSRSLIVDYFISPGLRPRNWDVRASDSYCTFGRMNIINALLLFADGHLVVRTFDNRLSFNLVRTFSLSWHVFIHSADDRCMHFMRPPEAGFWRQCIQLVSWYFMNRFHVHLWIKPVLDVWYRMRNMQFHLVMNEVPVAA